MIFDLRGQCGEADVLECIMGPNSEEESAANFDVYRQVYSTISHIIDLNWHRLRARPSELGYYDV